MASKLLCDPYIWESPKVLVYTPIFQTDYTRCVSERINHLVVVFALFFAVGYAAMWKTDSPVPVAVAALLSILVSGRSLLMILQILLRTEEGFQDWGKKSSDIFTPSVDIIGKKNAGIESQPTECTGVASAAYECAAKATQPSSKNPFMNVLIDELKYNPTRPAAASVLDPTVRLTLDEFFKTEFHSDPTDVFGKTQGQRQWITMPSTSIPNDLDSYQNWLYRVPGKTCKEGNGAACLPGTDGAVIPWLNDSTFTFDGSSATSPGLSERQLWRQKLTASQESAIVNRYPSPYVGVGSENGSNSAKPDISLSESARILKKQRGFST